MNNSENENLNKNNDKDTERRNENSNKNNRDDDNLNHKDIGSNESEQKYSFENTDTEIKISSMESVNLEAGTGEITDDVKKHYDKHENDHEPDFNHYHDVNNMSIPNSNSNTNRHQLAQPLSINTNENSSLNKRDTFTTELLNEMELSFKDCCKSPYLLTPVDLNKNIEYRLNNSDNEFLQSEKQKKANIHIHQHPNIPPRNVSRARQLHAQKQPRPMVNGRLESNASIEDEFGSKVKLTASLETESTNKNNNNLNGMSSSDIRIVKRSASRSKRPISYSVKTLSKDTNVFQGKQIVINKPNVYREPNNTNHQNNNKKKNSMWCCCGLGWWTVTTNILTFWVPNFMLRKYGGMTSPMTQKAWKEKLAICILIVILCCFLGFFTYGFTVTFCNEDQIPTFSITEISRYTPATKPNVFIINGGLYDLSKFIATEGNYATEIFANYTGKDASPLFRGKSITTYPKTCQEIATKNKYTLPLYPCSVPWSSLSTQYQQCYTMKKTMKYLGRVTYDWEELKLKNYILVDGKVLDTTEYLNSSTKFLGATIWKILKNYSNQDATRKFYQSKDGIEASKCLSELFYAGELKHKNTGCLFATTAMNMSVFIILFYIMAKFILAVTFSWIISRKMGRLEKKNVKQKSNMVRSTSWEDLENPFSLNIRRDSNKIEDLNVSSSSLDYVPNQENIYLDEYGDIYTILLVTCYSEGESGMRCTLDSLSKTMYDNNYKLLFVVADGIIKGEGNDLTTPEIIVNMIELDKRYPPIPIPQSYIAVADGSKRFNKAQVYVGWYNCNGNKTPIVVVVKCGTEAEQNNPKPGNRGKRDSQIILMNFFQKVLFNDPMTPLEFDLFTKIHTLMGITPDLFEIILMVDADTKVAPDSLARLVAAMVDDPMIMGLCGETRIANKSDSWVTKIQVFEYYISHHMSKAFESIFGGVTCLPGCFCMYRIKAPLEDGYWQPIISHPNIIQDYSQNVVETLHEKNLLFLGEDRFLTTLMLRTFPSRKLMFVPKAYCKTLVPDTFPVLLSQRRRWINSTIHNLFELVFVRQLCGIFCFSMQFVIALELFGTLTLPAAIIFTIVLIVVAFVGPVVPVIPLVMLACILGLPAVLVALTSRRLVYIAWMLIYLMALPIWNFVLPVYAYWHFDDFSWGETRRVQGAAGDTHADSAPTSKKIKEEIPLMKWAEYEKDRRRNLSEHWERDINAWKNRCKATINLNPINE